MVASPMYRLNDCADMEELLDRALMQSLDLCGTQLGNIQLMDWSAGILEIRAQRGFQRDFLQSFKRVKAEDGSACARALRTLGPVVIEDVECDKDFAPYCELALRAGFRAVQSTPLASSSGAIVGVLSTHFPTTHRPDTTTIAGLRGLAQMTANAIIHHRARACAAVGIEAFIARSVRTILDSRFALQRADRVLSRVETTQRWACKNRDGDV